MNIQELEDRFRESKANSRRPPTIHTSNRASEMGHPCDRYLVLLRTKGDHRSPVSPQLQAIFDEGIRHERSAVADLEEIGVWLRGSQRDFPPNTYQITGHVDGILPLAPPWLGVDRGPIVVEIKGLNPHDWNRLEQSGDRVDSLRGHRWMRRWYAQGQVYSFLADGPGTLFMLKNKATGWPLFVWCPLDLDYVQGLLDRAERINRHVADGGLPDYLKDPSECRRCSFFGGVCTPPMEFGGDGYVETAEDVIGTFDRWAELKAKLGKDAVELAVLEVKCKKYVRDVLGEQDGAHFFAGSVVAKTKLVQVKGYEVKPKTSVWVELTSLREAKGEADGIEETA